MIRHFKGSRSIGFWSYFMFGLERDQQAEDVMESRKTTFRILKDRYTGQATGKCIDLGYIPETGRIVPWAMMDLEKFDKPASKDMEF
jgi:twinkle protein